MMPSGWVSIHELYIIHYTSLTFLEITEMIERGALLSNYGIFHYQADSPSIKLPRLRNNILWVGVVYLIIATIKLFQMVNIPIFICIFVVTKKTIYAEDF